MIARPSLPRLDGYLQKRGREGKDPMNSKELKECNWELAWCSYWKSIYSTFLSRKSIKSGKKSQCNRRGKLKFNTNNAQTNRIPT